MADKTQAQFSPPTTNVDGSAITPGEIAKYVLSVGVVATPQTFPISFADLDVTPAADGTISVPLDSLGVLAPNSYAGIVTAVTAAGVSSAASNQALFSITPVVVTPNPPSGLKFV